MAQAAAPRVRGRSPRMRRERRRTRRPGAGVTPNSPHVQRTPPHPRARRGCEAEVPACAENALLPAATAPVWPRTPRICKERRRTRSRHDGEKPRHPRTPNHPCAPRGRRGMLPCGDSDGSSRQTRRTVRARRSRARSHTAASPTAGLNETWHFIVKLSKVKTFS